MKFASSWRRKNVMFVGEGEKRYKHRTWLSRNKEKCGFPDFAK